MTARPSVGATRAAHEGGRSAFGRPIIKEPVWQPEIPFYFYAGGLAGASAGLALLSDLNGERASARRAWAVALAGTLASPPLLIADLGVSGRFLNMLRMFKVTSPMSVGSWILSVFGAATTVGALHSLTGGRLGAAGRAGQAASAVLGLPLATYTGALLANTAVPAWHHARIELPFVFAAGAAMSAGAAAVALGPLDETTSARRLAAGGALAEWGLSAVMHRRLKAIGVGDAYHIGAAGILTRVAAGLSLGGAAVVAGPGRRSRRAAVAGAALLTAAAMTERWSVFRAGFWSARRPQDTVDPQRGRIRDGRSAGASRNTPRTSAPARPQGDERPGRRTATPGSPAIAP